MSIRRFRHLSVPAALAAGAALGLCAVHSVPRAQAQQAVLPPVQSLTDKVAAMQKQIDALQAQSVRDKAAAAQSQQMDSLRYNALAENLTQMQKANDAVSAQVQQLQADETHMKVHVVPTGPGVSPFYNPLYPAPNPLFQAPAQPPRLKLGGPQLPWTLLNHGPH